MTASVSERLCICTNILASAVSEKITALAPCHTWLTPVPFPPQNIPFRHHRNLRIQDVFHAYSTVFGLHHSVFSFLGTARTVCFPHFRFSNIPTKCPFYNIKKELAGLKIVFRPCLQGCPGASSRILPPRFFLEFYQRASSVVLPPASSTIAARMLFQDLAKPIVSLPLGPVWVLASPTLMQNGPPKEFSYQCADD